jgi:hypothetical protein
MGSYLFVTKYQEENSCSTYQSRVFCAICLFEGVLKNADIPDPELPAFVAEGTSAE